MAKKKTVKPEEGGKKRANVEVVPTRETRQVAGEAEAIKQRIEEETDSLIREIESYLPQAVEEESKELAKLIKQIIKGREDALGRLRNLLLSYAKKNKKLRGKLEETEEVIGGLAASIQKKREEIFPTVVDASPIEPPADNDSGKSKEEGGPVSPSAEPLAAAASASEPPRVRTETPKDKPLEKDPILAALQESGALDTEPAEANEDDTDAGDQGTIIAGGNQSEQLPRPEIIIGEYKEGDEVIYQSKWHTHRGKIKEVRSSGVYIVEEIPPAGKEDAGEKRVVVKRATELMLASAAAARESERKMRGRRASRSETAGAITGEDNAAEVPSAAANPEAAPDSTDDQDKGKVEVEGESAEKKTVFTQEEQQAMAEVNRMMALSLKPGMGIGSREKVTKVIGDMTGRDQVIELYRMGIDHSASPESSDEAYFTSLYSLAPNWIKARVDEELKKLAKEKGLESQLPPERKSEAPALKVGDEVLYQSKNGVHQGKIKEIKTDGKIVVEATLRITGKQVKIITTEKDPADLMTPSQAQDRGTWEYAPSSSEMQNLRGQAMKNFLESQMAGFKDKPDFSGTRRMVEMVKGQKRRGSRTEEPPEAHGGEPQESREPAVAAPAPVEVPPKAPDKEAAEMTPLAPTRSSSEAPPPLVETTLAEKDLLAEKWSAENIEAAITIIAGVTKLKALKEAIQEIIKKFGAIYGSRPKPYSAKEINYYITEANKTLQDNIDKLIINDPTDGERNSAEAALTASLEYITKSLGIRSKVIELFNKSLEYQRKKAGKKGEATVPVVGETGSGVIERELPAEAARVVEEDPEIAALIEEFLATSDAAATPETELPENPAEALAEEELPALEGPYAEVAATGKELSPKEKKEAAIGLHNIGFYIKEKKSQLFAGIFRTIGKSKTQVQKRGTLGRFLSALSETYQNDAATARERIEETAALKKKGKKTQWLRHRLANVSSPIGSAIKFGRTVADLTGYTFASPFRYVMMGSMAFARGAEAAKEARLKKAEVIEETRISDAEVAAEEAWGVYERARGKVGGGKEIDADDLRAAYLQGLPEDLAKRLQRESGKPLGLIEGLVKWDAKRLVERIADRIEAIDKNKKLSPAEKKDAKEQLIISYSKHLRSLDRMVSQYGTVDALAMGAQYLETSAKAVVMAMTVETVLEAGEKLLESLPAFFEHSHNTEAVINGIGTGPVAETVAATPPADLSHDALAALGEVKGAKTHSVWELIDKKSSLMADKFADQIKEIGSVKGSEGRMTYIIDHIKDEIAANPEHFGLPHNIDRVTPEDLDKLAKSAVFNKLVADSFLGGGSGPGEALHEAVGLSDSSVHNIEVNNARLRGELAERLAGSKAAGSAVGRAAERVAEVRTAPTEEFFPWQGNQANITSLIETSSPALRELNHQTDLASLGIKGMGRELTPYEVFVYDKNGDGIPDTMSLNWHGRVLGVEDLNIGNRGEVMSKLSALAPEVGRSARNIDQIADLLGDKLNRGQAIDLILAAREANISGFSFDHGVLSNSAFEVLVKDLSGGNMELIRNSTGNFDLTQLRIFNELSQITSNPDQIRGALEITKDLSWGLDRETALAHILIQGPSHETLVKIFGESLVNNETGIDLTKPGRIIFHHLGAPAFKGKAIEVDLGGGMMRVLGRGVFGFKRELDLKGLDKLTDALNFIKESVSGRR